MAWRRGSSGVCASVGAERGASIRARELAWMAESDRGKEAIGSIRGSACGGSKGSVRLIIQDGSAAAVVGRQRGRQLQCLPWRRSEPASVGTAAAGAVVAGMTTCGSVWGGVSGPGGGIKGSGGGFTSGLGDLEGRNVNNGSKPLNRQST